MVPIRVVTLRDLTDPSWLTSQAGFEALQAVLAEALEVASDETDVAMRVYDLWLLKPEGVQD
jgi:hypothetical protein